MKHWLYQGKKRHVVKWDVAIADVNGFVSLGEIGEPFNDFLGDSWLKFEIC